MKRILRRFAGTLLVAASIGSAICSETAARPINELPMYGGIEKNQAQLDADRAFIERVEKLGYTHKEGARKSITLGWRYFSRGDLATAMKRFNQAWLLDPDNPDTYHGLYQVSLIRTDGPNRGGRWT